MATGLDQLKRIVVLMLENRSFDHMLGSLQAVDSRIDPEAFVFRSKNGTAWIGDDVVKDNLKPLLQTLGIKQGVRIGMHAFRHGNASLMDKERVPLKVRQDRLGHVNAEEITLGRYTHAESQDHAVAAEK